MRLPILSVAVALAASAPAPVRGQAGPALTLIAARFRTAGDSERTRVEVFIRVRYLLLDPVSRGGAPNAEASYRITVEVRNVAGGDVARDSWRRIVPGAELDAPGGGGAAVERYRVVLPPGRYQVAVTLVDSGSGRVTADELTVDAPSRAPPPHLSDLLLGSGLRVAAWPGDTVPRAGEIRQGDVFLAGAPWPTLAARRPQLAYYAEQGDGGGGGPDAEVWVEDSGGERRFTASTRDVRGVLALPDLAPGAYQLALAVRAGHDTVVRRARFEVAASPSLSSPATPVVASDPFANASEARLDSLYGPLVYLMRNDERGQFGRLSVEGKRDYLRRFWARRDPTPGTPRNEALEDFHARLRAANRLFREGGAAEIPGWRTDRGRVYLRYGPPEAVLSRPQPGSTNPYEVWKYSRRRLRKFVFFDLTRFGNYTLIWTDDLLEVGRPNWRELLGGEAVEDVARF